MNLICPECSTVYRIDPARVPAGGVAAQCRECGAVFRVEAGAPQRPGHVVTAATVATPGPATAVPEPVTPEAVTPEPEAREVQPREPEAREAQSAEPRGPGAPSPEPAPPAFGPQDPETRARRLARALVSDIKVYNPDKWKESRRQGTLRKEFRDEILKSWDEFVEQVGEEMAKKTPYFRDALNEILAGGESVF